MGELGTMSAAVQQEQLKQMNLVHNERQKAYDFCHACNDEGRDGGCPRCGKTPRKKVEEKLKGVTNIASDVIPAAYQGKTWIKPESENLRESQFDDALEKVYNKFLKGDLPNFSMFISAPPKTGKMLFAYACMQTALVQGFSVAPMMTTSDWRRLYRVSQTNPMYKLYNKYKWDELVSFEVVFILVDDSEDRYDVIGTLKTIYDTRAMMGLPTFVISDYKLTTLVCRYRSQDYSKIYNPDMSRDFNRYPVIIHRFEE